MIGIPGPHSELDLGNGQVTPIRPTGEGIPMLRLRDPQESLWE